MQGYEPLRKGGLPRSLEKDVKADADSSLLVPVGPSAFVFSGGAVTFQVPPTSGRLWEDEQWKCFVDTWVTYLKPFLAWSHHSKDLGELALDSL